MEKTHVKRKRTAAVLTVLTALAILAAVGPRLWRLVRIRQEGDRLFAEGAYREAKLCYEQIGSDRLAALCEEYALEQQYLNGRRSLQSGDYDRARALLGEIADYKDAENLLLACDYAEAEELAGRGELERAKELYLDLGNYPGVSDRLRKLNTQLYEYALELADRFELEHAVRIWTDLGDWKDCAVRRRLGEAALDWLDGERRVTDPANRFPNSYVDCAYETETAYILAPEELDSDARFLLYYPGGYNEELYVDFFYYFLMNPPPDTIAVFLRQNGVNHGVDAKNREGIELLLRVGAERGVLLKAPTVVGSSLGAYPALYSALYTWRDFGLRVPCVMTLDAGNNWEQPDQMLSVEELRALGELHPDLYLFENPGLGLEREGIREMVEAGNRVCMVDCYFDEHTRMTLDAMGMGVLHWIVGDRTEPCRMEIYSFRRLSE